jgi:hypothetical protein
MSRATRKPMLPEALSGELDDRAAFRYRKQYDSWHKYEPPLITRHSPVCGPAGSAVTSAFLGDSKTDGSGIFVQSDTLQYYRGHATVSIASGPSH